MVKVRTLKGGIFMLISHSTYRKNSFISLRIILITDRHWGKNITFFNFGGRGNDELQLMAAEDSARIRS